MAETMERPPEQVGPAVGRLKLYRPDDVRLVVIVPALNEENTVGQVVGRVPRVIQGVNRVEVVVVDDGSTDATSRLATQAGTHVIRHPRPFGVGSAFQSGLRKVFDLGGDLVVNIDGDGQFSPEDIPKLIAPIMAGEADFVTASRFKDPALVPQMPWLKRWGNRRVSQLISRLTGEKFYDVSCGMRAYNWEASLSLSLVEPFTYTHEVFLHLSAKRMRIVEVPIAVRGVREFGKSRIAGNLFGYAAQTLKIVIRFYRDYYPLRFFSTLALAAFAFGLPLWSFFLSHYLVTGSFSPHKWAAFSGAVCNMFGIVAIAMGLITDMLGRHRSYLEEVLYHTRALVSRDSRRNPR